MAKKIASAPATVAAPAPAKTTSARKSVKLTDSDYVNALNTRKDEDGNPLPAVTLSTLWSECRAREFGHRSCRCGKDGCGNKS